VGNPVYKFLERMEALNIISDYNNFEIPKTRNEIASYLKEVMKEEEQLDNADNKFLKDLKVEFEYELFGTLNNSRSIIGSGEYDFLSENEKYLFFHSVSSKVNLFINLISEGEMIFQNDDALNKNLSTTLGYIGGEIRGTVLEKFGFYMRGYQGKVFGNTQAARLRKEIEYNYKFNLKPDEAFFDETEGYITADFDLIRFKLGRDRMNIGYGNIKSLVDNNSPMFDYLSLKINYGIFNFSYFHGKLLGNISFDNDSVTGGSSIVEEKYLGYHRIGFNISKHIDFGIGELIIYGDRALDLSYLNPFSFYKSVEHSNRDRDNSLLFLDFNNNSILGLKLYANLLVDDINFSKFGSGWWGNQTLLNFGFKSFNLYEIIPLDFSFDYLRIDPYTFTHRLSRNNFTHSGYNIGSFQQPNSELFFTQINYRFNYRLSASIGFIYSVHGANPKNSDGSIKENVGGDISFGHRTIDSESTSLLDGDLEYLRQFNLLLIFEPINQYFVTIKFVSISESLQNELENKQFETFINLSIKF